MAPAAAQATNPVPNWPRPEVATVANGNSYDLYVNDVKVTSVDVSDPAYRVEATVSTDARSIAVIPDHDGIHGSGLSRIDVATGKVSGIDEGPIASATFSEDSQGLAYAVVHEGTAEVLVSDGTTPGTAFAKFQGRDVRLLGWAADRGRVLVTYNPDVESDARYASIFASIDTRSGELQPILASDPSKELIYADFRLTTVKGEEFVSFVRRSHVYPCGGSESALGLATLDGDIVREYGVTSDTYRVGVWSEDASAVTYEAQACVQEAEDSEKELARLESFNGLYVADVAAGKATQVMHGLSTDYGLSDFRDGTVRVSSSRMGATSIEPGASPVASTTLDAGPPAVLGGEVWAVFTHQLWDTRDQFNGRWSCGPTSAVIGVSDFQLARNPINVNRPAPHQSGFGRYVSDSFAFNGSLFNRVMPDASGRMWAGAHGHIMEAFCNCAGWAREADFIRRVINPWPLVQTMADPAWVRARIDEEKLVVVSGNFTDGRFGHLSVIRGYTDDGRFLVHDTYGLGTDGSWDGANSVYTWDYMAPKQFWAF